MNKLLLVAPATLCAALASASAILSPTSIVSNTAGEFAPGDVLTIKDQSGLSSGFTSGVTDFDAYIATTPIHTFLYTGFEWFSTTGVTSGTMVLDLGADYVVDRFALWNEEFSGLRSITMTTSLLADFSVSMGAGVHLPANSPLFTDYGAEVFALDGGARSARYVKLDMTGPQPDNLGDYLSMGEIAFSVNPVPEPATMAVLGAGVAFMARRRKRA